MSIMSGAQYGHYCRNFGLAESICWDDKRALKVICGRKHSIGVALVKLPFKSLGVVIIKFLLLEGSLQSLMCLRDLKKTGLDISILRCNIICGYKEENLFMKDFFRFHNWEPADIPFALYNERKIFTVHRSFGHPEPRSTENLLRRGKGGDLDKVTTSIIKRIAAECETCKVHPSPPRRFNLTIVTKDLRFNHVVQVDAMFLQNSPVLHLVDTATHFCSA